MTARTMMRTISQPTSLGLPAQVPNGDSGQQYPIVADAETSGGSG
jgi:hypothetical protein